MPNKAINEFNTVGTLYNDDIFLINQNGTTSTTTLSTIRNNILPTGSNGQVLTYNGSTSTWVASAGGTMGTALTYGIVFDGDRDNAVTYSGTFSRNSTNTVITINNHGLLSKHMVSFDFIGDAITDGRYEVTKIDNNSFSIPVAGASASGTVTFKMCRVWTKSDIFVGVNHNMTSGKGRYNVLLSENIAKSSAISILPSARSFAGTYTGGGYTAILDVHGNSAVSRTENSFSFMTNDNSAFGNDCGEYSSIILVVL